MLSKKQKEIAKVTAPKTKITGEDFNKMKKPKEKK